MINKNLYQKLLPYLFKLDPEFAHHNFLLMASLIEKAISMGIRSGSPYEKNSLQVSTLNFKNRVGLAAGMDKNASYIDTLSWLGFGFIEVGTVTPKPQPGNKKPRLFRLPRDKALINSMGFNNDGLNTFVNNLKKSKWVKQKKGLIGINLGMNFDTDLNNAHLDYETGLDATYKYADYIVINISSPNTKGLRKLQENIFLKKLLASLKKKQKQLLAKYSFHRPIFIKISPDINHEFLEETLELIKTYEIEGVIATNTTIKKENILEKKYSNQQGGLSGAPLLLKSNQILSQIKKYLPSEVVLIGSGGIMSGIDASEKIIKGADVIQLYSGLIFSGPDLVPECIKMIDNNLSSKILNYQKI